MSDRFLFSVVMAVYRSAAYLQEAVDSLLRQTVGFHRIQLILVDDGSPDESGALCDGIARAHPEQVTVIHKENGGVASARNAGLARVAGTYVSFLDPDDRLDPDALEKAAAFFARHGEETDVCCIPVRYFGLREGEHLLNGKFRAGTRVIDLRRPEEAGCILLSCASAFYRAEALRGLAFDEALRVAEDARLNLQVLLRRQTLGVVADTVYHYRKHGASALDGARYNPAWYLPYLRRFTAWGLAEAERITGTVPLFVQHMLLYDLQWKLQQAHLPEGVLSPAEAEEYRELLFSLAARMEDRVILAQESLSLERKLFLLSRRHQAPPERCLHPATGRVWLRYGSCLAASLNELVTSVDFITLDAGGVTLEGSQFCPEALGAVPSVSLSLNGGERVFPAQPLPFRAEVFSADVPVARRSYFRVWVPAEALRREGPNSLRFLSVYPDCTVPQERVVTRTYAPVSSRLSRSWYMRDGWLLQPAPQGFALTWVARGRRLRAAGLELAFLRQIAGRRETGAKKAVVCRLMYHLLRPLTPRDIWLVTDKADRADDNGEAFFRYLRGLGRGRGCHPVFALGRQSPDWERLRQVGPVVPYMSWRCKLMQLLAAHTISAYSHNEISSPFQDYSHFYGDLLQGNRVVFLQHGIIKDDLSDGLNRYHKHFSLFVTSVERERDSVVQGNYGYASEQVVLTGLPRYDLLRSDTRRYITVMPTWSRKLCGRFIPEQSRWELLPGFEQSAYYRFYTDLLSDSRLLACADRLGYTIRLLLHPVFLPYRDRFRLDSRVQVLDGTVRYSEVFAQSALITTDYSSVAFDFAYLGKPVVYTQFEENHYAEGYFDYERDGFGEVEHTVEGAAARLIEYMEDGCRLKEEYAGRIDRFFAFRDRSNCQRVYEAIRRLDRGEAPAGG